MARRGPRCWSSKACGKKFCSLKVSVVRGRGRLRQPDLGDMVALLTLSVVLPCAYEYAFMERTAKSVWEMTPAERLEESTPAAEETAVVDPDGATTEDETT